MRHSFEEKLNIVSKVKSGQPINLLGRMLGICPKDIHMWLRRYDKYGESGLNRKKNASLSGSEKEIRVREYLEKGLSLPSISNSHDISVNTEARARLNGQKPLTNQGRNILSIYCLN